MMEKYDLDMYLYTKNPSLIDKRFLKKFFELKLKFKI